MTPTQEYKKAWRENNKERLRANAALYYQANKEKIKTRSKEFYEDNRAHCLRVAAERNRLNPVPNREKAKAWRKENPEKRRAHSRKENATEAARARKRKYNHTDKGHKNARRYKNSRYASDLNYRLRESMRARIRAAFKAVGLRKTYSVEKYLGCSRADFRAHLEKQFLPGMSCENYGLWEIDHIRPCASYDLTDSVQQLECFNFSNTQPLWKEENRAKGGRCFV